MQDPGTELGASIAAALPSRFRSNVIGSGVRQGQGRDLFGCYPGTASHHLARPLVVWQRNGLSEAWQREERNPARCARCPGVTSMRSGHNICRGPVQRRRRVLQTSRLIGDPPSIIVEPGLLRIEERSRGGR